MYLKVSYLSHNNTLWFGNFIKYFQESDRSQTWHHCILNTSKRKEESRAQDYGFNTKLLYGNVLLNTKTLKGPDKNIFCFSPMKAGATIIFLVLSSKCFRDIPCHNV